MDLKIRFQYALREYGDRVADPVQVRRDLLRASGGHLWGWAAEARRAQEELAAEADPDRAAPLRVHLADLEGRLAACAYQAFGLPRVDPASGRGVGEAEVVEVLKAYLEYAEKKD